MNTTYQLLRFGMFVMNLDTKELRKDGICVSVRNRKQRGAGKPETFTFLGFTHFCGNADGLFAGVALGYLYHFHRDRFTTMSKWWLLPLALVLLVPLFTVKTMVLFPIVLTCNMLAFALLLWWIVPRNIRAPWIEWVGIYSYSIYLWHVPLAAAFRPLANRLAWFGLYLVASILAGWYMSTIIEQRALVFRDKYFPNKGVARSSAPTETPNLGPTEVTKP